MRNKKLPEFTFLLEQFFTEYMPLSSGLSPNTVRSYKHSFRLLFQYIHQVKKKEAGEILFRDLDYETVDGFLRWIETERGMLGIHKEPPAFSACFFCRLCTEQEL